MRLLLATSALLVLLAVPALAGGGGHTVCSGFSEASEVALRDSCFEPTALISDGEVITVRNQGALPHTYTAVDGSFDTGLLQPGESATIEPAAGLHRVICDLHADVDGAGMSGVLAVGMGDGAQLTAASPADAAAAGADGEDAGAVPSSITLLAVAGLVLGALLLRRRPSATSGA